MTRVQAVLLCASSALASGCSLTLDTEKFTQEGAESCGEFPVVAGSDLDLRVSGTSAYSDKDLYVVAVTAEAEPKILAMARSLGIQLAEGEGDLDRDNVRVFMPSAFPAGAYRLYVFFEVGGGPGFQNGVDPGWIVPVCSDGSATLSVADAPSGAQNLQDPPPSAVDGTLTFTYQLEGFDAHAGRLFELRLIEEESNRTLAYVRDPAIVESTIAGFFPGLIEDGKLYRIDYWADNDADGGFSGVPDDHVWRVLRRGMASTAPIGAALREVHNTDFTDVTWEEAP